jgi:type II secretory pathway pseudopilin PulG
MLIVITIILILMGLMVVILGAIRRRAQIAQTKSLIEALAGGIAMYNGDSGDYPDSFGAAGDYPAGCIATTIDLVDAATDGNIANPPSPYKLFEQLCGADGKGRRVGAKWKEPYVPATPETKDKVRGFPANYFFIDAWGQPLRYFNSSGYLRVNPGLRTNVHLENFDLYSAGPDLLRGNAAANTDNVCNWQ